MQFLRSVEVRYGLEVLFMNFTKLPIILGIGYLLGVFNSMP
ncbi:accessory gene regulator B family protein [Clostridium sp.]